MLELERSNFPPVCKLLICKLLTLIPCRDASCLNCASIMLRSPRKVDPHIMKVESASISHHWFFCPRQRMLLNCASPRNTDLLRLKQAWNSASLKSTFFLKSQSMNCTSREKRALIGIFFPLISLYPFPLTSPKKTQLWKYMELDR